MGASSSTDSSTALMGKHGAKREHAADFSGPIANRSCTDVVCCVIFSLYLIGMIVVGVVAFHQGNPKRLLYPTDSAGRVCGVDVADKQFLHFFDLTKCLTKGTTSPLDYLKQGLNCPTPQVCVHTCPDYNSAGSTRADNMICIDDVTITNRTSLAEKAELISKNKCAPYYLKTKSVFGRCLPIAASDLIDSLGMKGTDGHNVTGRSIKFSELAVMALMNFNNIGMQIADELKAIWYWILIGFVVAAIASLLYIVLTRWFTFPLVVLTFLGVLGLLAFASYYTIDKYVQMNTSGNSTDIEWQLSMGLDDFTRNKHTWLVVGIATAVLFLVLFLISVFLVKRVRIACAIIAETSKAIFSMMSTLFFPLLPWLFQLTWFAWFLTVLVFLLSNGERDYRTSADDTHHNLTEGEPCEPKGFHERYVNTTVECLFARYRENNQLLRMQIFHLIGWLWGTQFIIAFGQCSLAGAFASYYFVHNKKDVPFFAVVKSMSRALYYHTGSLALGASIITIMKLIRIALEYVDRKLKTYTDSALAGCILKCFKCCFYCLEKFIKFINKNAYIMVAIYGESFCTGARNACNLLMRNALRTVAINSVTAFILLLGRLLITGGVAVASFYFFHYDETNNMPFKLKYSAVPVLITTVGAYLVSTLFMSVFDMGIDTIFLCFLEDEERNDGSAAKPYFMAEDLREILEIKKDKGEENEAMAGEMNGAAVVEKGVENRLYPQL